MYIDFHCDTLMLTWENIPGENVIENTKYHLDLKSLVETKVKAQFFAIYMLQPSDFTELQRPVVDDREYIYSLAKDLQDGVSQVHEMEMAYSWEDYKKNLSLGKTSCFLTIEDGRYLTNPEKIREVYELGVRLVSITWNFPNALGYPNSTDPKKMEKGLTSWGRDAISLMNDLGILIDVSHLSDGGFWDIIKYSKKPILASHSNARAITNHPRNLTDDMIKTIGNKGGIIGLNFSPTFLNEKNPSPGEKNRVSRIEDMILHLHHIKNKGGIETLALGTDFDGVSGYLEIDCPQKYESLCEAMKKGGFTEREIDMFLYKNGERFLRDTL
ncbi:MAG: membrane dipeptidase [Tissierellia bacterium]|nr:membrane dipeptidase [Tissierellia bacterium]